jgi:hypothetical protein
MHRNSSAILRKKSRRGFKGYPVATIAFYGPTDAIATKIAAGIIIGEEQEPSHLERWHSDSSDIRHDATIQDQVLSYIQSHRVKTVLMTDSIIGCPHEEGTDYPTGTSCPQCPYWEGRDRFTHEIDSDLAYPSDVREIDEINFQCKRCHTIFDCVVGNISVNPDTMRPVFEKSIICPKCGLRTIDEVYLTELGQSQMTEATWNL